MFGLSKIVLLALALSTAQAAPLHTKRIAQVITAATQKWEAACVRIFIKPTLEPRSDWTWLL